ncbi:MAG: hypothetical protein IGS50_01385 [Synechococcales cyanobacterium C42_A2020_086]|jgi:hypothetical protein|nr:hypothetical protein [Synechococcales cyanobacterium C42_A2020_086]
MLGYSGAFAPSLYHLRRYSLPELSDSVRIEGVLPVHLVRFGLASVVPPWDGDLEIALEREMGDRGLARRRVRCKGTFV